MPFTLSSLPYAKNALSPFMSEETLELHYGKHHQTYVDNLNKMTEKTPLEGATLEHIIQESIKNPDMVGIFNNAAQNYNHIEFWNSLKKNIRISPFVESHLKSSFGSLENFKNEIITQGTQVFGSGWVWLYVDQNQLKIGKFSGGDNPLAHNGHEILGCDVWEHSYYIDYRNRRADYLKAWFENLINWEYVEEKMKQAKLV